MAVGDGLTADNAFLEFVFGEGSVIQEALDLVFDAFGDDGEAGGIVAAFDGGLGGGAGGGVVAFGDLELDAGRAVAAPKIGAEAPIGWMWATCGNG